MEKLKEFAKTLILFATSSVLLLISSGESVVDISVDFVQPTKVSTLYVNYHPVDFWFDRGYLETSGTSAFEIRHIYVEFQFHHLAAVRSWMSYSTLSGCFPPAE